MLPKIHATFELKHCRSLILRVELRTSFARMGTTVFIALSVKREEGRISFDSESGDAVWFMQWCLLWQSSLLDFLFGINLFRLYLNRLHSVLQCSITLVRFTYVRSAQIFFSQTERTFKQQMWSDIRLSHFKGQLLLDNIVDLATGLHCTFIKKLLHSCRLQLLPIHCPLLLTINFLPTRLLLLVSPSLHSALPTFCRVSRRMSNCNEG